jgi:hypothetical protein
MPTKVGDTLIEFTRIAMNLTRAAFCYAIYRQVASPLVHEVAHSALRLNSCVFASLNAICINYRIFFVTMCNLKSVGVLCRSHRHGGCLRASYCASWQNFVCMGSTAILANTSTPASEFFSRSHPLSENTFDLNPNALIISGLRQPWPELHCAFGDPQFQRATNCIRLFQCSPNSL